MSTSIMSEHLSKFAPYLHDPFVLVGFLGILLFLFDRTIIKSGVLPPVAKTTSGKIVNNIIKYKFIIFILVIVLAFFYKYLELGFNHINITSNSNSKISSDISRSIVVNEKNFSTSYTAEDSLWQSTKNVKVKIRYPQILGHPDKNIERKINDFFINWAGVNADHPKEYFDHEADFEVVSLESNTLTVTFEAGGVFVGGASGATINKTAVINLINGEKFELKDLFRAGYHEELYKLVKQRAFCDQERVRLADDIEPIRDNQEFFLKRGNLVLVYQRREICSGADGPTFVTLEGEALKSMLNPNGPFAYLL